MLALCHVILGAKEREVWNSKGQLAVYNAGDERVIGNLTFIDTERGPRMCMGEKIYVPINGLVDCKRVLRNGKKRSKGRKCKFRCEKGFFLKRNKGYQDRVII